MKTKRHSGLRQRPENRRWKPEMGILAPLGVVGSVSGVLSSQAPSAASMVSSLSRGPKSDPKSWEKPETASFSASC